MSTSPNQDDLRCLVHELCKLPQETEWVEFKVNNYNPQDIGEYISALANTAALLGKVHAYMLWGVEDATHAIIGTNFSPLIKGKGSEPLEAWLSHLLNPRIDFRFREIMVGEQRVVMLEIDPGRRPVAFRGIEYIRVGSTTRKLKDYPEKERALSLPATPTISPTALGARLIRSPKSTHRPVLALTLSPHATLTTPPTRMWSPAKIWPKLSRKQRSVTPRSRPGSKHKLFIIGGAEIYEQTLPLADEMILTHLPIEVEGDAYFPAWDESEWVVVERRCEGELVFATYRRR